MNKNKLNVVRAFIDNDPNGGNPAGVVLDADALSLQEKQSIAREAGFPETAFISKSQVGDFKVEFFTPNKQIAHCGHATVASFSLLQKLGRIGDGSFVKESIEGPRNVHVANGQVFLEQSKPKIELLDLADSNVIELLNALSIESTQITNQAIYRASVGVPFVVFGLSKATDLAKLSPNMQKLATVSESLKAIGVYLFTFETSSPSRHASARMFAPLYGIPEEAATGMGAGALASVLYDFYDLKQTDFVIEQGHFMSPKSPSLLNVNLFVDSHGKIQLVKTGGRALVG